MAWQILQIQTCLCVVVGPGHTHFYEEQRQPSSGSAWPADPNNDKSGPSRACGLGSLRIFHLKNLGPLTTKHLTTLYNSIQSCHLPSIWKTALVIPISKPGKDSSQSTSYRPISLLCPASKVLEALILPSINEFLSPAQDQHGFRPRH